MTPDSPALRNPGIWRIGFYTQKSWSFEYHRWTGQIVGRGPYDSPPRSFDAILSIGPLRWRIYREHPVHVYQGIDGLKICPGCGAKLGRPHLSHCHV